MANAKPPINTDDMEFTTVSDGHIEPESKVVFDTLNDSFTGTYLGQREVPSADGNYKQARFEKDGELYFVNANHSLREGLKTVRNGAVVRMTYVDDLDTGMAQPMRVFKVEVAKNRATRSS